MAKTRILLALLPAVMLYSDCSYAIPPPSSLPNLTCPDRYSTESHGTTFYACRSEVSPQQPGPEDITERVNNAFDLVGTVKQYERDNFGMQDTVNYREFNRGIFQPPTMTYRLYVTPPFLLAPEPENKFIYTSREFREEITLPAVIFSRADDMSDEEAYYKGKGYDVKRRVISDFSPGCNITESFMASALERQIEMVFHEDWHYNMGFYWGKNLDDDLEESIAALTGLAMAVDFAKQEYGIYSETYEEAGAALEYWKELSDFINSSYDELSELYARDMPDAEKARLKQEILARRAMEFRAVDNASIMAQLPYTRVFPFAYRVYLTHPDLKELVEILKQTPNDEEEGITYLENSVWR